MPSLLLIYIPILLITIQILCKRLRSPLLSLPGPWHTKFTDLYLMIQEFRSNRRLYIHSLHQKYGPVVRLGPNEVSFTSLEAVKEIYSSGGSGYDKTEFYTLFMQFGKRTAFSTLGKVNHSQKRRYIASQYANTNIMRPEVLSGIQNRADAFIKKCSESKGRSLDSYIYLHCYALDCASHHLFGQYGLHSIEGGYDYKMMEEQTYHESLKSNLIQYRFDVIGDLILKVLKPRPSPLTNTYVLSTCKKQNPSPQSLLYKLQESKSAFGSVAIAAECMDHLAAGIDTTGDGLCFIMHALSLPENQSIQAKLQKELREAAAEGKAKPGKSLDDLPYLEAVIKEGLRCFPPIPMSAPRYVPAGGRTIDGYFVPYGTIVSCQAWSVHRLNEEIYPDGDSFVPERWLEGNQKEKVNLDLNRLFFAFGGGGRGCVGRHLAMAEMKCLLKEVYSIFTTRIAHDMHGSMEMSDQIISSRPLGQTCKLEFQPLNP